MSSLVKTVKLFGQSVTMTIHRPTNEEYNAYSNEVMECIKDQDEERLMACRTKQFDAWLEAVKGMDKGDILDRQKSSIMFQIFEKMEVDEKN